MAQLTTPPSRDFTQLLRAWQSGDEAVLHELSALVESELHRLARKYMAVNVQTHAAATALINEAWLRLIDWRNVSWQSRAHFFAVSAQLMRHILVDHARRRPRVKEPSMPSESLLSRRWRSRWSGHLIWLLWTTR